MRGRPVFLRALAAAVALAVVGLAAEGARSEAKPKGATKVKTPSKKGVESASIELPDALAPFFQALDALKTGDAAESKRVVRILHFGDSHTASDFLTGRLRQLFQESYGDAGPGLLLPARPWRGYQHEGVQQEFGRDWPAVSLRDGEPDAKVGLPGVALSIPKGDRLLIRSPLADFRLHVLGPQGEMPAVEIAGGDTGSDTPMPVGLQEDDRLSLGDGRVVRILGPAPPAKIEGLTIALPEESRLLGVDARSGRAGVLYDELGLNGAMLLDLERWDPAVRQFLLRVVQPSLLVLAYGTNDMGRMDFDPAEYRARTARLLAALKTESGAPILVVGPPDRDLRRQRANPKANASAVIAALRGASLESGCAFWDARKAMGGQGAIQRWRKQGLARRDLVHFTAAGYRKLGEMIHRALLEAKQQGEARGTE
jgi:lysophospholipase L1-like esterase